jgi:Fe2+ or Zn2+ uptake regulation protein
MNKTTTPEWPEGMKRTLPRIAVWEELIKYQCPRSAQEISDSLRAEDSGCCLSTVYRILEAFEKHGVVIRSRPADRLTAFFALASKTNSHYAICVGCSAILPVEGCPCEIQLPQVGNGHFHVTGHRFELLGYCDKCYKKKVSEPENNS